MADFLRNEYGELILDDNGEPIPMGETPPSPAAEPVAAPAAPVAPPRNRMYMGPMTGDPNASPKEFFQDAPNNTFINRQPPPIMAPPTESPPPQEIQGTGAAHPIRGLQTPTESPPPQEIQGPQDAGQMYDMAAKSGPGPAATAAWNKYVATGQTSTPARVFPPMRPGALDSKTLTYPTQGQMPDPNEEIFALSQKMGAPLNQTMQAVEAQRRYQAQRGYQADLANNMSATDAMTKWGPMLFTGAFGRAAVAPKPSFHNVAGAGYAFNPATGTATRVTPPAQPNARETLALARERRLAEMAAQQLPPAAKAKVDSMKADIAAMRKALMSPTIGTDQQNQFSNDIATLNSMIQAEFRKAAGGASPQYRVSPPGSATATSPMPSPAASRPSPFKEGAIIRQKGTGKRFKIVNGQPVAL